VVTWVEGAAATARASVDWMLFEEATPSNVLAVESVLAGAETTGVAGLALACAVAIHPVSTTMPTALAEPAASRARWAGCGRRRLTIALGFEFVSMRSPFAVWHVGAAPASDHRAASLEQAEYLL
jgi:hypothetical protein